MSASGVDRLTVAAHTAKDAEDVARRQWETFGFRMVRVLEVRSAMDGPIPGRWRVEAEVAVVRR